MKRYLSLIVTIVFLCYTVAGKDQVFQKQQKINKDGEGWKAVVAVVCTIAAATIACSTTAGGATAVATALAGAQVVYVTGDKAEKEKDKKIFPGPHSPSPFATISSVEQVYYDIADAIAPYHLTPSGDAATVIFIQKVNNMADKVIELNSHSIDPDSIFMIYLRNYAQAAEEVAVAFDNTGFNFSITQADIQHFKDSCAAGHLPYIEDIALTNAGLSQSQKDLVAAYFATIPLYLTQQPLSISTILHAQASYLASLQTWVPAPTLTEWGFIILMLLMVSSSAWMLIRKRSRLLA